MGFKKSQRKSQKTKKMASSKNRQSSSSLQEQLKINDELTNNSENKGPLEIEDPNPKKSFSTDLSKLENNSPVFEGCSTKLQINIPDKTFIVKELTITTGMENMLTTLQKLEIDEAKKGSQIIVNEYIPRNIRHLDVMDKFNGKEFSSENNFQERKIPKTIIEENSITNTQDSVIFNEDICITQTIEDVLKSLETTYTEYADNQAENEEALNFLQKVSEVDLKNKITTNVQVLTKVSDVKKNMDAGIEGDESSKVKIVAQIQSSEISYETNCKEQRLADVFQGLEIGENEVVGKSMNIIQSRGTLFEIQEEGCIQNTQHPNAKIITSTVDNTNVSSTVNSDTSASNTSAYEMLSESSWTTLYTDASLSRTDSVENLELLAETSAATWSAESSFTKNLKNSDNTELFNDSGNTTFSTTASFSACGECTACIEDSDESSSVTTFTDFSLLIEDDSKLLAEAAGTSRLLDNYLSSEEDTAENSLSIVDKESHTFHEQQKQKEIKQQEEQLYRYLLSLPCYISVCRNQNEKYIKSIDVSLSDILTNYNRKSKLQLDQMHLLSLFCNKCCQRKYRNTLPLRYQIDNPEITPAMRKRWALPCACEDQDDFKRKSKYIKLVQKFNVSRRISKDMDFNNKCSGKK